MKVLALACLIGFAASVSAQDASIERAVDGFLTQWADGWNRGDAAACVALHTEDGDRVGADGNVWKGHAAMQESLAETITAYGGSTLKLTRTGLHVVSPEVVVTDGAWGLSGGTPEDAPTSGFYTFILSKEGDGWKAVSLRIKVPPAN